MKCMVTNEMAEERNCSQQFWQKCCRDPMRKQELILLPVKIHPQSFFVAFETFTFNVLITLKQT